MSSGAEEVYVTERVELLVIKTVVQFAIEITGMVKDHIWIICNRKIEGQDTYVFSYCSNITGRINILCFK